MDIKKKMDDVKQHFFADWKKLSIIAGVIFVIAIALGIFWPKKISESVKKQAKRATDLKKIYLDVILEEDMKLPEIRGTNYYKLSKNNKVNKKSIHKNGGKKTNDKKFTFPGLFDHILNPKKY